MKACRNLLPKYRAHTYEELKRPTLSQSNGVPAERCRLANKSDAENFTNLKSKQTEIATVYYDLLKGWGEGLAKRSQE